ncbi:MAG: hypothetical protein ACI85I_000868 [Arenicella sp.]|jgi:hypothetical protein
MNCSCIKSKLFFGFVLLLVGGCRLNNLEVNPAEDYFRVFDVNTQLGYEAHDIELLDDGYLIYGTAIVDSSQGSSLVYDMPYLLKLDLFGTIEWDTTFFAFRDRRDKNRSIDNSHKQLTKIGDSYIFTGYLQDAGDSQIRLLSFNLNTRELSVLYTFNEAIDAIEAIDIVENPTSGGFYASASQCFNSITEADRVSLYYFDVAGNLLWNKELTDSYLCEHSSSVSVNASHTELYHDIGYLQTKSGTEYVYLKTALNPSAGNLQFSLLFADPNTGDTIFSNIYNDIQVVFDGDEPSLQTGMPIVVYTDADDSLQLATVNFTTGGEELLYPNIDIKIGSPNVGFNENVFSSNELALGVPILIEEATVDDVDILIYAGTTREGRILISVFNKATGRLLNKKYFGYNSYYEVGGITQTADGGLIIAGHTITAGRFQQLTVIKVSQSRLAELLKLD